MVATLDKHGFRKDTEILNEFYTSVKQNLANVDTLAGKQTVIKNLYDSFFKGAFPKAVDQLGIVYTPVECVDFILRSVDAVLRKEFDLGLTDKGVHILDPFVGTGTFITRLLQSGLIKPEDMERKYKGEIHCNELVLLAYYVADVNIESVFNGLIKPEKFEPFDGICLTDTFELAERDPHPELFPVMKKNAEDIERQRNAPIRVIVGNPPYSVGQKSGNDNAQNLKYPKLDERIEETYVAAVNTTNKNSLYDSYIRAFRWASDRLKDDAGGVIGFITNAGWLDGNAAAGFRHCLEREFSSIYVFHLRGDQRTSGELSRKEGGKIFGAGSRAPVAITILVKKPGHTGKAKIHYCDIGDYLNQRQKLDILKTRKSIFSDEMQWQEITPNEHDDWIRQRSDLFGEFILIGDKNDKNNKQTFFEPVYSTGVQTNRDAWVYNYSKQILESNIRKTIAFYNEQCEIIKNGGSINLDPLHFSWTDVTRNKAHNNKTFSLKHGQIIEAHYRPFCKRIMYFSSELNHRPGNMPHLFPQNGFENQLICINGTGGKKDFSCFITDKVADLEIVEKSQCFPRYTYKQTIHQQATLLGEQQTQYTRSEAVSDWILKNIRGRFGLEAGITKKMIFYYVYGILHSREYRTRFNDDLKKSLPRIPITETLDDFLKFANAGEALAELHLNYESQPAWADVKVLETADADYHVEKMKFYGKAGSEDKTGIIYNPLVMIENIPLRAYEYVVNGRSAIEWIMESYRIKTDKDSGILNDPNLWAMEHNNPRYILDLLLSVITVSMKTLEIVDKLPGLELQDY